MPSRGARETCQGKIWIQNQGWGKPPLLPLAASPSVICQPLEYQGSPKSTCCSSFHFSSHWVHFTSSVLHVLNCSTSSTAQSAATRCTLPRTLHKLHCLHPHIGAPQAPHTFYSSCQYHCQPRLLLSLPLPTALLTSLKTSITQNSSHYVSRELLHLLRDLCI